MSLALRKMNKELPGKGASLGFATWALTAVTLASVGLLAFAVTPGDRSEDVYADDVEAEARVNVATVASIALEYYDPSSSTYVDSDKLRLTIDPDNFKTGAMRITTSTNSSGGMKLSMNDSDSNNALVEQGDSQSSPAKPVISSITSNKTIADVTDSGKAFSDNTWGYAVADTTAGSSAAPAVPLTYSQIPTTETLLDETDELGDSAYIFTAGVRVGRTLPAGTYKDQLTFTVIANPLPRVYSALHTMNNKYMQDADLATVCADVITPLPTATQLDLDGSHKDDENYVPSITMKDRRDEQEYTIRKLADGNCWMTENLRYGINPDGTGHPWVAADADLTDSPDATKMADLTYNASSPNTAGRIKNGDSGMKTANNSYNAFSDSGDNYTEPYINIYYANAVATYDGKTKQGVQYNYCAATGGTVCSTDSMSEDATSSICPKGWKLPGMTANATGSGATTDGSVKSYNNLANSYGYRNNQTGMNGMLSTPIDFVRAGGSSNGSLKDRSGSGQYWASTKYTSTSKAYYLLMNTFSNDTYVRQYNYGRYVGFPVRCVLSASS